jgi:hypothetical protein
VRPLHEKWDKGQRPPLPFGRNFSSLSANPPFFLRHATIDVSGFALKVISSAVPLV